MPPQENVLTLRFWKSAGIRANWAERQLSRTLLEAPEDGIFLKLAKYDALGQKELFMNVGIQNPSCFLGAQPPRIPVPNQQPSLFESR